MTSCEPDQPPHESLYQVTEKNSYRGKGNNLLGLQWQPAVVAVNRVPRPHVDQ
ncbi:hypothetical protein E2C01_096709 [Portunus trituberculatus]|uniref:Uncharacterized protein n=1 Tax=Portunus trituberculatus TaxID=210409 RepID=A0A5B7JWA7_PORTR|nr:hypothetical protein [Portunus trituberculatus]